MDDAETLPAQLTTDTGHPVEARKRRSLREAGTRPPLVRPGPPGPATVPDRERRVGARLGRVLGGRSSDGVVTQGVRRRARTGRGSAVWSPTADQLVLLASLDDAGLPADRALATLARMASAGATRNAIDEVVATLRAGGTLGAALEQVHVPAHVTALVVAGEHIGRTGDALRGAAELVGRLETLRAAVRRALVYPALVLGVGVVILTVVAVVVAPAMAGTFSELGGELPAATVLVLRVSDALRDGRTALGLLGGVGAALLLRGRVRIPGGEQLARRTPGVRRVRADLDLAVLARMLATLLAAGVPLVAALRTAERAVNDARIRVRIGAAADAVERGGSAIVDGGLAPLLDPAEEEILRVGEVAGLLAAQWLRVAERRTDALEARIHRIGVVLEPVLVVLVGALVGGAVLALYLPTFRVLDLL
jgi:type IV pilus assembly protein PilC